MSVDHVREYLRQFGAEDRVLEFDVSSATVELAAAALHCEPGRIAKTLSFRVDETPILFRVVVSRVFYLFSKSEQRQSMLEWMVWNKNIFCAIR